YMPDVKSPADERFTKHFILNGGKFLYCVDMNEVQESFDNILLENDWYENDVYCIDENLTSRFKGYNLNYGKSQDAAFLFSTCENLVADDGSLLICSHQIKEKKLKELPQDFVIFATTSQIVNNIGEGLRGIKSKNTKSIPTNITTIKNFEPEGVQKDFMSYGSSAKNLYLLLLEDL
ncbi:MAG: LUD domain-containing protein, partial [Leeuwenhoekiella sp.]